MELNSRVTGPGNQATAMESTTPQLALAMRHHQLGQLDTAERLYREIVNADPGHADALHLLGVARHQQRDTSGAVDYISRAIQVDGSMAIFHSNLGAAYQALGDVDEAVKCFRDALRISPACVDAWSNLAAVLQGAGRKEEAIAAYRELLTLVPDDERIRVTLAALLAELGRPDEANTAPETANGAMETSLAVSRFVEGSKRG